MSEFQTQVYRKGDKVRVATSPAEVVSAEFDGFKAEGVAPAPELFDPSKHSVEEVQDHLATADDNENARVVAAEAAGKNRVSIVG
jgi:predicted alternative tryptophan synthase beta-subunit